MLKEMQSYEVTCRKQFEECFSPQYKQFPNSKVKKPLKRQKVQIFTEKERESHKSSPHTCSISTHQADNHLHYLNFKEGGVCSDCFSYAQGGERLAVSLFGVVGNSSVLVTTGTRVW